MIVTHHLIKKLLFILLLAFISNSAVAKWTFLGSIGTDYKQTNVYVDYSTLYKESDFVRMWVLRDFKHAQGTLGMKFLSAKTKEEYDCKGEQSRILFYSAYSGSMGTGQSLYSGDDASPKWKTFLPGSNGEELWKIACNKFQIPPERVKWLKIKVSKSGDVFYLDPDTIYKDGQYREVWNLLDSSQKDSNGVHSSVMRIKYDCKNEKWRGLDMLSYSGAMGSGQILDSTLGGSEWMPVRRGTSFDTMLDIVCDKRG